MKSFITFLLIGIQRSLTPLLKLNKEEYITVTLNQEMQKSKDCL